MLSKKDKEWLREMVKEEISKALTVKVRFEKRRDPATGQPLAVPEIEVKDVNLVAHWVEFLPHYEAAIRGVQETADHAKNNSVKSADATAAIAAIILGLEDQIKSIGQFAAEINKQIEHKRTIPLDGGLPLLHGKPE